LRRLACSIAAQRCSRSKEAKALPSSRLLLSEIGVSFATIDSSSRRCFWLRL
jgi:hypothetical protein